MGKSIVIFINQLRMKIGVTFGNAETTTGGNALKFYASVRLDVGDRKDSLTFGNKPKSYNSFDLYSPISGRDVNLVL